MNPFYRAPGPESPPPAPPRWSYSALQEWRQCPRRWWLLRARYAEWVGRYPQPMHTATIAGRLVHDALEAFAIHSAEAAGDGGYEDARRSFSVRRFMKQRLRNLIGEEVEPNPRADTADLLARLSLDECVNQFRSAAAKVILPVIPSNRDDSCSADPTGAYLPDGPERTITVEDPPLTGRLDWTKSGTICDFKTGDSDPTHPEQLRMYALLAWIAFGVRPKGLEVHYVRTDDRVEVPVPSEAELEALRDALRHEITAANRAIRSGSVSARPSEEQCRWCPVRQHCDAFWSDTATEPLRWPACAQQEKEPTTPVLYADVELTGFLGGTSVDGYHGAAQAGGSDQVAVSLPAAWSPGPGVRPERVHVLGARIEKRPGGTAVSVSRHTEVFWLA